MNGDNMLVFALIVIVVFAGYFVWRAKSGRGL